MATTYSAVAHLLPRQAVLGDELREVLPFTFGLRSLVSIAHGTPVGEALGADGPGFPQPGKRHLSAVLTPEMDDLSFIATAFVDAVQQLQALVGLLVAGRRLPVHLLVDSK